MSLLACGPEFLDDDLIVGEDGLSVSVAAVEDTFVDSARPYTSFGSQSALEIDSSPSTKRALLRFRVQGLPTGATVSSAQLRVYVKDRSPGSITVSRVNGTWRESTTHASAPAVGSQLGTLPPASNVGTWISADLRSFVTGNGDYSVYLTGSSADGTDYNSSEANNKPRLAVTYTTGTTTPPPPPPPEEEPTPEPENPAWAVYKTYDLSRDEGWNYTTGVRTNTDQSYNRREQVTFGANGMTITAERATESSTIYSADAMGRFGALPDHFAVEADIELYGLGSGMFPAFWFRPMSGQGELDVWEYCGAYIGTYREMKSTIIKTGSNPYNLGSKAFGIPLNLMNGGSFEGMHKWRYEKTPGKVTLYVDGQRVGEITKAQLDASAGAGSWDSQFEAGQSWYPRMTFQIGDGTAARLAGPIPSSWRKSTMRITRLVAYKPR